MLQLQQLSFTIQILGERVQLGENPSRQDQDTETFREQAHAFTGEDEDTLQDDNSKESVRPCDQIDTDLTENRSTGSARSAGSVADDGGVSLASMRSFSRQSTLVESNDIGILRPLIKVHSMPKRLNRSTCSLECSCACHRRNRLKSPDVLRPVLGSLNVGYKASPWPSQKCDKKYCRSQETKITYAFPQWLLRRAISVSMAYAHPQGPDLCLRMIRVRSGDANIFTAVYRGTCNHIQRLLDDNEASVLDVDPAHNTALQVRPH